MKFVHTKNIVVCFLQIRNTAYKLGNNLKSLFLFHLMHAVILSTFHLQVVSEFDIEFQQTPPHHSLSLSAHQLFDVHKRRPSIQHQLATVNFTISLLSFRHVRIFREFLGCLPRVTLPSPLPSRLPPPSDPLFNLYLLVSWKTSF